MNCYNFDGFHVVDQDDFQVFGDVGLTEDLMVIGAMNGKQHQFGSLDGLAFDNNGTLPYLAHTYDSPNTDQSDLAALPNVTANDFEHGYLFTPNNSEPCSRNSVVSTSGHYSTLPATAPNQYEGPAAVYDTDAASRKRRASVESYDADEHVAKRIHVEGIDPSGEYFDVKDEPSPYSSVVPTPTNLPSFHGPYSFARSPRANGHQHSTSQASQISVPATAPYTPTVSSSFTSPNSEHSPCAPDTPGPRPASVGSNPKLVRTSTIPQHSPQSVPSNMTMIGHTQNFNPYTLYSPDSKARIHMQGNLDDVAQKWSEKELEARRKIVVFNRSQKGNDIYADFEVVSQDNWKNHPRSVSCIWWAEKKEAYVTSVDTILLLEALVAARFTVEEKNRIRRNLEGFKPDTVSKAKPDTEEFFKVIMGFPNPKPRNIEKDVKVFPWRILSVALQKIISKYSASYASTASSLVGQPKMARPMDYAEYTYSTSPGPEYHNGMQVANFPSYEHAGRLSAPATPAPQMHLNPHVHHGFEQHAGFAYSNVQMPSHGHAHYSAHPMTAPVTAPAYWHYPVYTTEATMPMPPASAPPTAYPREMIATADFRHMHAGYHH